MVIVSGLVTANFSSLPPVKTMPSLAPKANVIFLPSLSEALKLPPSVNVHLLTPAAKVGLAS